MQPQAVKEILSLLPERIYCFKGSEYPLPIKAAFLGDKEINLPSLRRELIQKQNGEVKDLLESLLLAAELCEAACEDKDRFFLTDRTVQSFVFKGSKWRAGWALVLGGKDQNTLTKKLKERDFMVFTDLADMPDTVYIGGRVTAPVYFAQLMVRYGLVWGRIAPGDDHKMTHFLEEDLPGLIIIHKDLPALKYLITLGLMKLGAPAVVPSTFPFPYGRRAVADNVSEIVEKGSRFPNLRQRYYEDEIIGLPDYCDPAFAKEEFEATRRLGGLPHSFFCVRPAVEFGQRVTTSGQPGKALGVMVEIAEKSLGDDVAVEVEKVALRAINFISGVRAYDKDGIFCLELGANAQLDEKQIAEAIYWGIRSQFPRLKKIAVRIVFDQNKLLSEADKVRTYKKRRRRFIETMTEENTEEFCACTECRSFSLEHTCILTPGWIPMCASRSYPLVKAAAYFGSRKVPWKRKSEKELPLRRVFKKGKILDSRRGEYEGCNRIYREMTGGRLNRVHLHSLKDYPPTSCGCFNALAFWIEKVKGIGIMLRDSGAASPDGQTWAMLANRAGGKQSPGFMGVSLSYIRSPNFLKGDGGIANVVWVDSGLYEKISDLFLNGQKVATEKDVTTVRELKDFLGRE